MSKNRGRRSGIYSGFKNPQSLMRQSYRTPYDQMRAYGNDYYSFYYNYLCELAMSVFKWTGLPESVDPRYLELSLLEFGYVLFVKDSTMGYLVTRVALGGKINHYLQPTSYTTMDPGYQGKTFKLGDNDNEIIWNNYLQTPTFPTLMLYARDLTELNEIIKVNQNAQKTPVIIKANDWNRDTWTQIFNRVDGNAPTLITSDKLDMSDMQALNTQAPYVVDKLQVQKDNKWNEIMTFLGINNANMNKKERMNSKETESNNSQVNMGLFNMLKARQLACEHINKTFPELNVKVESREMSEMRLNSNIPTGGDGNGSSARI